MAAPSIVLFSILKIDNLFADQNHAISLSEQEKTWLRQHKVVRMGVDENYAPYSYVNSEGLYKGVAADFMQLISERLNISFQLVPGLSWPEILDNVKNTEIDVVNVVVKTPERQKYLAFTQVYVPTPLTIMVRTDDFRINGPQDLINLRIALVEGYSSSQKILSEYTDIKSLWVSTPLEGLRAVSTGSADAYVGSLGVNVYQASKHGIHNVKVAAPYEMVLNGQRIAVRKDWPVFVSVLDKAIDSITEEERIEILNRWVPVTTTARKYSQLVLSKTEKLWLQQHNEIRLAVDPEFAPVEFVDNKGEFSGIAADYISLLNRRLGISIRMVPGLGWSEAIELAKQGKIDMFSAITPTEKRRLYLNFTQSYIKYPFVIITRDDYQFISGLSNLNGKSVTVVKDYVTHELMQKHHPAIELQLANSIYDALHAVSTGSVDAFVGDTATSTYIIRKNNLANLKVAAPTDFKSKGHSIGIRKDWPQLVGILNKALDSISQEERLAINKKWIDIEVEQLPANLTWIALVAGGLIFVFVITSTVLRIQVRRKTQELSEKNQLLVKEIDARNIVEHALSSSEQRLMHFFHATIEMVFFHDNGRVLDVNPALLNITGYSPEDLIGKHMLSYTSSESIQTVSRYIGSRLDGQIEVNILKKNGTVLPVEVHARSIELEGRKVSVVSMRDITERKNSELAMQQARQELQIAYDDLEVKVQERTHELATANRRLLELDKLKSMFIASMSHELRTPLNSIIGFTGIILQGMSGEINDKQKDQLNRVFRSSKHLLSLITDVIDISKIEVGGISAYPENFKLADVVDEAYSNVQNHISQKGIRYHAEVADDIILFSDRKRIFQCLLNYLSNASKYTETGDIKLTVLELKDVVKISVTDTGIGIAQSDMKNLFEAFERFESELKIKEGGSGLGLYLTKKIATEILHGEVSANSELGKGSTFQLTVPLRLESHA